MNLRELLLQFTGESDVSFKVEDIVTETTDNIYVMSSISNGVKVQFINENLIEGTRKAITEALEKKGYEVDIYECGEGINIEVE